VAQAEARHAETIELMPLRNNRLQEGLRRVLTVIPSRKLWQDIGTFRIRLKCPRVRGQKRSYRSTSISDVLQVFVL
jgi:hypothetical protein